MIVVDASLVLKLVLDENDSEHVRSLWRSWTDTGEILCAPALFGAETASAIRNKVYRGLLTRDEGQDAFAALDSIAVEIREPGALYLVARRYAERLNRPTVYDSCYLALADIIGCELWTADRRSQMRRARFHGCESREATGRQDAGAPGHARIATL